jgi:hypothetical protein
MNGLMIEKCMRNDLHTKNIFLGVYAFDELPSRRLILKPSCFIFNTEPRSEDGEHWLACFIDENGFCNFFDSYGLDPKFYGLETYFESTFNAIHINRQRIQGASKFCGLYCILYLLFRSRHLSKLFYNKFSSNFDENDLLISKLLKENR